MVKRALEQSDANVQSTRDPKQQKRDEAGKDAENQTPVETDAEVNDVEVTESGSTRIELHKELEQKKPEEYICVDQPRWDQRAGLKANADDDDEDEDEDEDSEDEGAEEPSIHIPGSEKMWPKPAADHPEWKWTMMWKSFQMLCEWNTRGNYTVPDNFSMYMFSDWYGYGMQEMAENAINEFSKEYNKKDSNLDMMWAPVAMLGRWLCENIMEMTGVDDGERTNALIALVRRAFLTALHVVERAGKLTKDSELRDLGLVMSLYLEWSHGLHGLEDYGLNENDDMPWREHIAAYAQEAGIDLRAAGCNSMNRVLNDLEEETEDGIEPLADNNKADRWNFKKTLREYAGRHGVGKKIGGRHYDITKMSRAERASESFDGEDPLKDVPNDVLKQDRLGIGMGAINIPN